MARDPDRELFLAIGDASTAVAKAWHKSERGTQEHRLLGDAVDTVRDAGKAVVKRTGRSIRGSKVDPRERQAYLNASPQQREVVRRSLLNVLAVLRAQSLGYQTSHWQVGGMDAYGNHLLFARLYESVQEQIDQIAEKIVGYLGAEAVQLSKNLAIVSAYAQRWESIDCPFHRGMKAEEDFQGAVKMAYDSIKGAEAMTLGLDDWLMGVASDHEENTYLLQQVMAKPSDHGTQDPTPVPVPIMARKDQIPGGLADSKKPSDFDQGELEKGTKVEMEHVDDPALAQEIAMDHLVEISDYYTRLEKMESAARAAAEKVAPTAEGEFYKDPRKREVREFAETGAISNDPAVAAEAAQEENLDLPTAEAVAEASEAPPTPSEVKEEKGGDELSTLNRYVIKSEDPKVQGAARENKEERGSDRLAANWLRSLVAASSEIEYRGSAINWHAPSKTFSVEMSWLSRAVPGFRLNKGLTIISPKGGRMTFTGSQEHRDRENDVTHWTLVGQKGLKLTIWNT